MKRVKRSPVKLTLLGNFTRKRSLNLFDGSQDVQDMDEHDPGPGASNNRKKLKIPAYSEDTLDRWIEDLAAMFGDALLGLGEAVPKTASKEP